MLCGVTATLGSNPSATATAARPHWGWAVLLCPTGVSTAASLCLRGGACAAGCGCVTPLVFPAPGPAARALRRPLHGCCLVRWRVARCLGSLHGLALPPPAGTVAPQLCLPDHRTPSTSVGRPFEMRVIGHCVLLEG